MADEGLPETLSRAILAAAIVEGRASELISCLWDGGSCTVNPYTGKLVLASADMLKQLGGE